LYPALWYMWDSPQGYNIRDKDSLSQTLSIPKQTFDPLKSVRFGYKMGCS
jgi:hypothetical protein